MGRIKRIKYGSMDTGMESNASSERTLTGIHGPPGNQSEIFKILLILVRPEIRKFSRSGPRFRNFSGPVRDFYRSDRVRDFEFDARSGSVRFSVSVIALNLEESLAFS